MNNTTESPAEIETCCAETNGCCGSETMNKAGLAETPDTNGEEMAGSAEQNQTHKCANCSLKARYERNPGSIIGRFWKWHTGFCPRWKSYMKSLSDTERATLIKKYGLKH